MKIKKNLTMPIFLSLFLLTTFHLSAYQYNLAVCAIFRDEARFLKEWIEFHKLQGAEHFYLYNNLSQDDYLEVLNPYIQERIVELIELPIESTNTDEWHLIQLHAYNDALLKAKGKVKWLAILDSDEFAFATKEKTLLKFLKRFEKLDHIGGVCLNWHFFGMGGVKRIPDNQLMIDTLIKCEKEGNSLFKSIVRPERVKYCCNPHFCIYQPGFIACTAINSPISPLFVFIEEAKINHYWSRDQEFFYTVKLARRLKWGNTNNDCAKMESLYNSATDRSIRRFSKKLRKAVFDEE